MVPVCLEPWIEKQANDDKWCQMDQCRWQWLLWFCLVHWPGFPDNAVQGPCAATYHVKPRSVVMHHSWWFMRCRMPHEWCACDASSSGGPLGRLRLVWDRFYSNLQSHQDRNYNSLKSCCFHFPSKQFSNAGNPYIKSILSMLIFQYTAEDAA